MRRRWSRWRAGVVGPDGCAATTHDQRILDYITPDFVHVFVDGRIVEEGGPELAIKLELSGYEQWEEEVPAQRRLSP